MSVFPYFSPLESDIVGIIQNTNKKALSGAAPFVVLQNLGKSGGTIGLPSNYINLKPSDTERFPPIITNLEVKPTGNLGVIREASVTVKFSSKNQMEANRAFFSIGSPKSVRWGWNKTSSGTDLQIGGIDSKTAKSVADNIDSWREICSGWGYHQDVLVGPLMNFDITLNSDATVDVTFIIGTKNEIPAYLGSSNQNEDSGGANNEDNGIDTRLSNILGLKDISGSDIKGKIPDFNLHVLNYDYAKERFTSNWISGVWQSFTDLFSNVVEEVATEKVFIDLETFVKYRINNDDIYADYNVNIEESYASTHPNQLSNDEDVIFLSSNKFALSFDSKNKSLKLTNPNSLFYVGNNFLLKSYPSIDADLNIFGSNYKIGKYGRVKNIYLSLDFYESVYANYKDKSLKTILQVICDKINKATSGITNLTPSEGTKSNGKQIYTIIDTNLSPSSYDGPSNLNIFGENTRIIDVAYHTDLPKEIIGQTMLSESRYGRDYGAKNTFFRYDGDPQEILGKKTSQSTESVGGETVVDSAPIETGEIQAVMTSGTTFETGKSGIEELKAAKLSLRNNAFIIKTNGNGELYGADDFKKFGVSLDDKYVAYGIANDQILQNGYFGKSGINKNNPLLPIDLELTVLGISGITVGKILKISDIPFSGNGVLQVLEVTHSVDNNQWITKIKLGYRPDTP